MIVEGCFSGSQARGIRWARITPIGLAVTLTAFALVPPLLALDKASRNKAAGRRDLKIATVDMAHIMRRWYAAHPINREHNGLQERTDDRASRVKRLYDAMQASSFFFERACLIVKRRLLLNEMIEEFNRVKRENQEKEEADKESVRKEIGIAVERAAINHNVDLVVEKQWLYYPRNAADLTIDVIKGLDLKPRGRKLRKQPPIETEEE